MTEIQKPSGGPMTSRKDERPMLLKAGQANDIKSKMDPVPQDAIGKKLREEYSTLLAEPLPDKFVKLLSDLSSSEKKS